MSVNVVRSEKLNFDEIKNDISILEAIACDNIVDESKEMIDGLMEDENFTKITLSVGNNMYELFHGFPGDNPRGCIKHNNTIYEFGECAKGNEFDKDGEICDNVKLIREWYTTITKECCTYKDKFWYAQDMYDLGKVDD
jgi:hypothetical protein